ncbi:MAG: hypothetical protein ACHQM6_10285 [Candidatus Kapaibacterium sp.]
MKKLLFTILLSILLNSCFIFRAHDSSEHERVQDSTEDAPSYLELQGVYYSEDSLFMATLILASDASFDENHYTGRYGRYILTLRDSSGEKHEDGNWDYLPQPGKDADYNYGEGACGLLFHPFSKRKDSFIGFIGYAYFEFVGKQRRLIISCERGTGVTITNKRFLHFQRRAYSVRY